MALYINQITEPIKTSLQKAFIGNEPGKDVKNGNAKVFKQPGLLDKNSIRNRPFLLELNITKRGFETNRIDSQAYDSYRTSHSENKLKASI